MNTNKRSNRSFLTLCLLLIIITYSNLLIAQATYELDKKNHELKVEGTSTIHDWHMNTTKASGTANLIVTEGKLTSIDQLQVQFDAETLKSGKRKMDKNAYKALNTDDHSIISYTLDTLEILNDSTLSATGNLEISGHKEPVSMNVNYALKDGAFHVKGSLPITFTQFSLEPPTAVFGTIKTGDELTLSFNATFLNNQ